MDAGRNPGRAKALPPSVLLKVGLSLGMRWSSTSDSIGFNAYLVWSHIRLNPIASSHNSRLISDF